jgi:hypothetical protein
MPVLLGTPVQGLLTPECMLQVLWAATTNIGCAAILCNENLLGMGIVPYTYTECRYSPPRAAFNDIAAYQANVFPIGRLHR